MSTCLSLGRVLGQPLPLPLPKGPKAPKGFLTTRSALPTHSLAPHFPSWAQHLLYHPPTLPQSCLAQWVPGGSLWVWGEGRGGESLWLEPAWGRGQGQLERPPPPVFRPQGVTTKFHSPDSKEIESLLPKPTAPTRMLQSFVLLFPDRQSHPGPPTPTNPGCREVRKSPCRPLRPVQLLLLLAP